MGITLSSEPKTLDSTKRKDAKKPSFKDVIVIRILPNGFSPSSLTVFSGQAICWEWDSEDVDIEHNIKQVTLSDHIPIPVPNGLSSQLPGSGFYEATINTPGTYHFTSDGHTSVRVGTIKVIESPPKTIKVSDHKFSPNFVEIGEGDSITWRWDTGEESLHRLQFCPRHCGITTSKVNCTPGSNNVSYTECFQNPGMYYFTENSKDVCIIKVVKRSREVSVVIQDNGAKPSFVNAYVGDRIWVRNALSKNDGVMMIKSEDGGVLVSSRRPVFKADRQPNLLSYCFSLPGIYRVTFISGLTTLCSLVLVQPKQSDYVVNVNQQGFLTELGSMKKGDRIWWVWLEDQTEKRGFLIAETEQMQLGDNTTENKTCHCTEEKELLSSIGYAGVMSSVADTPGLFSYRLKEIGDWTLSRESLCSVIIQSVSRDHIVQVNDHTFHPQIVNVHPGDSVTWVWRDTMKSHNIQQVSHERMDVDDGFHSSCLSRSPDAFSHVFTDLGIFYFASSNICGAYGAVVVTTGNQVHKVEVTLHGVDPDPVGVRVGDLVCWRWNCDERYSVNSIQSPEEIEDIVKKQPVPSPRRCLAQTFSRPGLHHVVTTAYLLDENEPTLQPCDSFLNTIYVDHAPYASRMKVSCGGFEPDVVVLAKHDSILWYWDNPEEKHNIVLVENPKGRSRPIIVHGPSFFESGPVMRCSSFFHTFDTPGSYWVTSYGMDGKTCRIDVLSEAKRLLAPVIVGGNNGGSVEKGYTVNLSCDDNDVQILYTVDGTQPGQQNHATKVYDNQEGIVLSEPGLFLVRALSTKDGWINSRTYTSRRFWVFSDEESEVDQKNEENEAEQRDVDQLELRREISNWQWFNCVPSISFYFVHDNVIHIDIVLSKIADHSLIAGFQIYINGLPHGDLLRASCPGVLVSGLAGYRVYHMVIVAFPNMEQFRPQLSNQIVVNCPPLTSMGGPLISLETCSRVDAVVIVWAANHSCQYIVLINGHPMGEQFFPEPDITYCRVLFEMERTQTSKDEETFIICVEMKQENNQSLFSNEIQLSLPLPEELVNINQPTHDASELSDEKVFKVHNGKSQSAFKEDDIVIHEHEKTDIQQSSAAISTEIEKDVHGDSPREPAELLIVSELTPNNNEPTLNSEVPPVYKNNLDTIHEGKQLEIVFTTINEEIDRQEVAQISEHDSDEEHELVDGEPVIVGEELNIKDGEVDVTDEQRDITGGGANDIGEEPGDIGEECPVSGGEPGDIGEKCPVTGGEPNLTGETQEQQLNSEISNDSSPCATIEQLNEDESYKKEVEDTDSICGEPKDVINDTAHREHDESQENTSTEIVSDGHDVQDSQADVRIKANKDREGEEQEYNDGYGEHRDNESEAVTKEEGIIYHTMICKEPIENSSTTNEENRHTSSGDELESFGHEQCTNKDSRDETDAPYESLNDQLPQNNIAETIAEKSDTGSQNIKDEKSVTKDPESMDKFQDISDIVQVIDSGVFMDCEGCVPIEVVDKWQEYSAVVNVLNYLEETLTTCDMITSCEAAQDVLIAEERCHPVVKELDVHITSTTVELETRKVDGEELYLSQNEDAKNNMELQNTEMVEKREEKELCIDEQVQTTGKLQYEEATEKPEECTYNDNQTVEILEEQLKKHEKYNGKDCIPKIEDEVDSIKDMKCQITNDLKLAIKGESLDTVVIELDDNTRVCSPEYSIVIWGEKFTSNIDSLQSYDFTSSPTPEVWPSEKASLKQHVWLTSQTIIEIQGLKSKQRYSVAVFVRSRECPNMFFRSDVTTFTMTGRPKAPVIRVLSMKDRECNIGWRVPCCYGDATIIGYKLVSNGTESGDLLPRDAVQHTIINLEHGAFHHVSLIAVTGHVVGDSPSSNVLTIACPYPPPPPEIAQCLSASPNAVSISWAPVSMTTDVNQLRLLSSYDVFVDDVIHGSCPTGDVTDLFQDTFTYTVPECIAGRKYSIYVRGHVDPQIIESSPPAYMCGCYGEMSNILQVNCAKEPFVAGLVVDAIDENRVELSWNESPDGTPHGLKGYVLRVDGRIYGNILDPEARSVKLTRLSLGNNIALSLTPLLDQERFDQLNANLNCPNEGQDSGVESSSSFGVDKHIASRDLGPCSSLTLHLWGLVRKVYDVRIMNVTCCAVEVRWNLLEHNNTCEERPVFVDPEGYRVKVFKSEELNEIEIMTLETKDMNVKITDLAPSCRYAVTVEAFAHHANYTNSTSQWNTSISDKVRFDTKSPPLPPENIKVVFSTANSVCLSWDPLDTDNTLKFIYVDVHKIVDDDEMVDDDDGASKDAILNFVINPHMTSYTINSLESKTKYLFTFNTSYNPTDQRQHCCSSNTSIKAWTSGVDRPRGLHVTKRTPFSLHIAWQPAVTYGDLSLLHYRVHYAEKKSKKPHGRTVSGKTLDVPQGTVLGLQCELKSLEPGVTYTVAVQAVIINNESSLQDKETEDNDEDETASSVASSENDWVSLLANDCLSKSMTVNTIALPGKPELLVTGISATQIHLAWNRPPALYLEPEDLRQAKDQELSGRIRQISGYTLEVNGRVVARLPQSKHSFTIKRCKPGMKYTCYLVAMTTIGDAGGKEKKNETKTKKVTTSELTDSEDEETYSSVQEARSDGLEVTIPRQDPPLIINIYYNPTSAHVSSTSSADSDEPDEGCVVLEWKSSTPLKGVASYKVHWSGTLDDQQGEEDVLKSSCASYEIYPVKQRCVYSVWLKMTRKEGPAISYGPFHCQVPGRPDPCWIWCRSVSSYRLQLEWNEPRTYGIDTVRAYQINLNGRQLGKLLSPQTRKAAVHCQPNSVYRIVLMALTTDPHLGDPEPSNLLTVCTPGKGLDPKQSIRLKPLWAENDSLYVEWSDDNDLLTVDHYVIKWSSVLHPQSQEKVISVEETSCCIEDCKAGTRHFIAVAAIDDKGKLVSKSPQLIMQTSAPLVAPQLQLYSAIPSSIIVQWSKPLPIGDATVDAYEIKVNGEITAVLDSDELSYEWTDCSPCEEYKFKIKALSSKDDCHSDWSQPLPVVCPGACQPVISRAPSNHVNSIHVTWDTPSLYGGARVEHYKVHYLAKKEDIPLESILENPDVITQGPLKTLNHSDTLTNAHPSLPYLVVLEASLLPEGCHRVFSQPIRTRVAIAPDPPCVNVKVLWRQERITLERFASRLAQLKDRICCKVQILQNTVVVKGSKQKEIQIAKNNATIRNLDIELTNCVQFIKTHTGTLNAEVSWALPRDDGDATITGYQVFINNQKHEKPLDMNNLKVDLKLPASPHDHVITLRSLTSHPIGHSEPSSEITLPTKDFLPFVQFCYFGIHSESSDCCYEESLSYEIKNKHLTTHRGTLGKPLPSPVCYVTDVFNSCTQHLVEPSDKPLVILFWTVWCHSSFKAMEMFIEFSRNHNEQMNFTTCCVQSNQPASGHHHCLREQLTSNEWITNNIRHLCGCHPAGQQSYVRRNEGGGGRGSVSHMYGLVGVPTIVLCNQDGYMTWQGRICAHNFAEYEKSLLHAFHESLNEECTMPECDQCEIDHELDTTGFPSQILSNPHDNYNYKNAKQDSSLVVTGRLSKSELQTDYHSRETFPNVSPSVLTESVHPGTLKNTEFLRRRLHNTRPKTSPSKETSLPLAEANVRPLTRAKTANQTRNSIFKSRFSSSMTSSLPSLALTNGRAESGKNRSPLGKPKKVTISVDEFSPA